MTSLRSAGLNPDAVAAVVDDDPTTVGDGILGKLVWYTISDDIRVTPEELATLFDHFGIDRAYLPKEIRPDSVLLAILRSRRWEIAIGSRTHRLAFAPEVKVDGSIEAPLARERRRTLSERAELSAASGNPAPEWEKVTVATLVWDRQYPDRIAYAVHPECRTEYPYDELLAELHEEWDDRRTFYGRDAISGMVAKILDDCRAVPTARRGAVWFVHPDAMDLLDRVEQLIHLLDAEYRRPTKEGERRREAEFDSVILVDREKNRLMVRSKVERVVVAGLDAAIAKLADDETATQAQDAVALRRSALAVRDYYAGLIDLDTPAIFDRIETFDRLFAERTLRRSGRINGSDR
jgi:hypothetical protein